MPTIAHILLPLPLSSPFSYAVPQGMALQAGDIVRIPFGRRIVKGVVWHLATENVSDIALKDVIEVIPIPPLPLALRDFIEWVAGYTMAPSGSVLKMAMSVPAALEPPTPDPAIRLAPAAALTRATSQRKQVIDLITDGTAHRISDIIERTNVSRAVIKGLLDSGVVVQDSLPIAPQTPHHYDTTRPTPTLSTDQEHAALQLCTQIDRTTFSVTLLDGVTGSGKTEVYFAAIEHILRNETGQVVILLPEIVLTAQLIHRVEKRFGFVPGIWHSSVSDAKRRDTWRGIANGSVRLIIGARSALFLPFASLKAIIIDEEHESAFKQEEGVIYHARDMAIVRAMKEQIPIFLASATPSLETVMNCDAGKYTRLSLPDRYGGASMPKVDVVDMRSETLDRGHWLSSSLKRAIASTMAQGNQSMLFLNRRGYAPLTLCRGCGHRLQCPHCSSWLVEHRHGQKHYLQCHHCGYGHPPLEQCPACGADKEKLAACGPGVERLAEEVTTLFPQATVLLMTSDTVSDAEKAAALIDRIMKQECDIIIGTQMIAKGHHFPHLKLVGIVDADLGLAGGDLRAAERTYQLLHQVAGRAGREGEQGYAIIQSYMPESTVIHALATQNRDAFLRQEADSRQLSNMPPFTRLAAIIISGKNELAVMQHAKQLAKHAPSSDNFRLLGPAPAPLYQLRGKYRYRLFIKAQRTVNIQKTLQGILSSTTVPNDITVKVDIDPYNFL